MQLGRNDSATAALWALHSCDQEIIFDMRAMNGATKHLAFGPFWKELEEQLPLYKRSILEDTVSGALLLMFL